MNFQWIHLTYNISINYTLLITCQYTVNVHIFHYLLQQPQIECKSELDQPPDVASFFNADEKFSARSWLSIVGNISVISKIRNNNLKCTIHDVKIQLTIIIIIDFTNIILMPWLRDWSLDMLAYDSVTWYVSCRMMIVLSFNNLAQSRDTIKLHIHDILMTIFYVNLGWPAAPIFFLHLYQTCILLERSNFS